MGSDSSVASVFKPLLRAALGPVPTARFEFWDGSAFDPPSDSPGTVRVNSRDAVGHLVWAPGELGVARAYVSGELDFEGDIFKLLRALQSGGPDATPGSARTRYCAPSRSRAASGR